jgi:hypothetical protein
MFSHSRVKNCCGEESEKRKTLSLSNREARKTFPFLAKLSWQRNFHLKTVFFLTLFRYRLSTCWCFLYWVILINCDANTRECEKAFECTRRYLLRQIEFQFEFGRTNIIVLHQYSCCRANYNTKLKTFLYFLRKDSSASLLVLSKFNGNLFARRLSGDPHKLEWDLQTHMRTLSNRERLPPLSLTKVHTWNLVCNNYSTE